MKHSSETSTRKIKLDGERAIQLPLNNLISIIVCATLAGSAYWNLNSSVSRLQTTVSDIVTELDERKDWAYDGPVARIWQLESAVSALQERIKSLDSR